MKKFQNKKSGFSMLELVVVMLIMGTLAGIRISKMGGSDTGAIKASMKSDLRGAIASVNACYADKLDYKECDKFKITGTDDGTQPTATTANPNLKPAPSASKGNTIEIADDGDKNEFPTITVTNTDTTIKGFTYTKDSQSITEQK